MQRNHLKLLSQIRAQLSAQQSSLNECLAKVDEIIMELIGSSTQTERSDLQNEEILHPKRPIKKFPGNIKTKRDKLEYIVLNSATPLTANEVKAEVFEYGEELPNVDQSLVNLEKDKKIASQQKPGERKKYTKPILVGSADK